MHISCPVRCNILLKKLRKRKKMNVGHSDSDGARAQPARCDRLAHILGIIGWKLAAPRTQHAPRMYELELYLPNGSIHYLSPTAPWISIGAFGNASAFDVCARCSTIKMDGFVTYAPSTCSCNWNFIFVWPKFSSEGHSGLRLNAFLVHGLLDDDEESYSI